VHGANSYVSVAMTGAGPDAKSLKWCMKNMANDKEIVKITIDFSDESRLTIDNYDLERMKEFSEVLKTLNEAKTYFQDLKRFFTDV
jgi:hypothetical protein